MGDYNVRGMCELIQQIRQSAEELERKAGGIQAVMRSAYWVRQEFWYDSNKEGFT